MSVADASALCFEIWQNATFSEVESESRNSKLARSELACMQRRFKALRAAQSKLAIQCHDRTPSARRVTEELPNNVEFGYYLEGVRGLVRKFKSVINQRPNLLHLDEIGPGGYIPCRGPISERKRSRSCKS